jgi:hypothetical protein
MIHSIIEREKLVGRVYVLQTVVCMIFVNVKTVIEIVLFHGVSI